LQFVRLCRVNALQQMCVDFQTSVLAFKMISMKSQTLLKRETVRRFDNGPVNERFRSHGMLGSPVVVALSGVALFLFLVGAQVLLFSP